MWKSQSISNRDKFRHTKQTANKATENGNRAPERILRKMEPGMANVCKLNQIRHLLREMVRIKRRLRHSIAAKGASCDAFSDIQYVDEKE